MANLTHGFSASLNAGWKDGYVSNSVLNNQTADVQPYWRLDARLAYSFRSMELFIAGQNLSRPVHQAEFNGPEVPRTIYGGMSAKFR
jgi:hypothetical protein